VFDPEYLSKRKTKAVQEKSDEIIEDIDTSDDDLIDESDDDLGDEDDEIVIDEAKN
jgi:hypothetical protein